MQVPSKLTKGENFRSGVVNKINNIIDYLRSQRVIGNDDTISINQCVNGLAIKSIVKPGVSTGELKHYPFRVYFYNSYGQIYCNMQPGKIFFRTRTLINGNENYRVWNQSSEQTSWANGWRAVPKTLQAGEYTLWGCLKKNSVYFFFSPKDATGNFNYSICNEDCLSWKIADIKKENVYPAITSGTTSNSPYVDAEGNLYTVTNQYIYGDLFFEEMGVNNQKIDIVLDFQFPENPLGYLEKTADFTVPKIEVYLKNNFFIYNNEKQKIYIKNTSITYTPEEDFQGNLYAVLTFHDDTNYPTFTLSVQTSFPYVNQSTQIGPIYDETTKNYKFLLARIHLEKPYIQRDIIYYFNSDIFLDFIKGKTKVSNLDSKYQYLEKKFTADRKYIDWNTYPVSSDVTSSSSSSTESAYGRPGYLGIERAYVNSNQAIRYVFDYPHIDNFNSSKVQKLIHQKENNQALQWREDETFEFGNYLTSSSVDSYDGKVTTVNVNKNAVFADFQITGGGAANVTGSGNRWSIYVSSSSGGGGGVSITGTSPINVTGGNNAYNVSLSLPNDGILIVSSGTFTSLPLPAGNAVLISQNGALSWAPFGDCSSASSSSSSN